MKINQKIFTDLFTRSKTYFDDVWLIVFNQMTILSFLRPISALRLFNVLPIIVFRRFFFSRLGISLICHVI